MSIHKGKSGSAKDQTHPRLKTFSYASRFFEALDTPISLSCYMLLKYNEHRQLAEKKIDPRDFDYGRPDIFYKDYQAVKLLSKCSELETGIDTKHVALSKFVSCEAQCKLTNERIRNRDFGDNPRVQSIIFNAQRKIVSILGDVPRLDELDFAFGPGATYGIRKDTSVFNKVKSTLECTHAFVGSLEEFLQEFPGWIVPDTTVPVTVIPGSQLTVVPKNAKTDRPICIEPLLNGLYQKGVGSYLRERLHRHGIDLNDQSVNQFLASQAGEWGLATVDFESASDSISFSTVMELLPFDWFEFLDVARSPRYESEGNWYNFHKFSSMGNGYTFELETLIFYSIAYACCLEVGEQPRTGLNLSVYGDDVIIPRCAFDLFSEVTGILGFTINENKSFSEGPFFESCGHDFFSGHFVRPFLLSKSVNNLLAAFYAANTLWRFNDRLRSISPLRPPRPSVDATDLCANRLIDVFDWVVGCVPVRLRVWGPEGYGDGHFLGARCDSAHPRLSFCWDGWKFHSYLERPKRVKIAECLTGYALYFNRAVRSEVVNPVLSFREMKIADPLDNGEGYSIRRAVMAPVRVKMICHFTWQDFSWYR